MVRNYIIAESFSQVFRPAHARIALARIRQINALLHQAQQCWNAVYFVFHPTSAHTDQWQLSSYLAPLGRGYPHSVCAVRCKNAMVSSQVDFRFGYQGGQFGGEILRGYRQVQ